MLHHIFSEQTCGEACWSAREDECRCSCGGKNHGILRTATGTRPARESKIAGVRHTLHSVGSYREMMSLACKLNKEAGHGYLSASQWTALPFTLKACSESQKKWQEV